MLSHALMCCSFAIDYQVPWENQLLIAVVFLQCQQFLSPLGVKDFPSLRSRYDILFIFSKMCHYGFFFFFSVENA